MSFYAPDATHANVNANPRSPTDPLPVDDSWHLIAERGATITAATTASQRVLLRDSFVVPGAATAGRSGFPILTARRGTSPGSDYALRLLLQTLIFTNDVDPNADATFKLFPITDSAGATGIVGITLGAAITGSTVLHANAGMVAQNDGDNAEVEFAMVADGNYAIGFISSATTAAASDYVVQTALYGAWRHI